MAGGPLRKEPWTRLIRGNRRCVRARVYKTASALPFLPDSFLKGSEKTSEGPRIREWRDSSWNVRVSSMYTACRTLVFSESETDNISSKCECDRLISLFKILSLPKNDRYISITKDFLKYGYFIKAQSWKLNKRYGFSLLARKKI